MPNVPRWTVASLVVLPGLVACSLIACNGASREGGPPEAQASEPPPEATSAPIASASGVPSAPSVAAPAGVSSDTDLAARLAELDAVTVVIEREDGRKRGSGAIVSARGDVLTAVHVVDEDVKYRVVLPTGAVVPFTVTARDTKRDIAAGRIAGSFPRWLERGPAPIPGEWVICAGFPSRPADSIATRSTGVVASTSVEFEPLRDAGRASSERAHFEGMTRADCGTSPGMSGGPVLDLRGRLIGVVTGAGGTLSPLDDRSEALRAVAMGSAPSGASPVIARVGDGGIATSKWLALQTSAISTPAPGSIVALDLDDAAGLVLGAIVAPNRVLTVARAVRRDRDDPRILQGVAAKVKDQPDAGCNEVVAVRGELALLSCTALRGPPLDVSVAAIATPVLAQRVMLVDESKEPKGFGFVTGLSRKPGLVALESFATGCGTSRLRYRASHPAVPVGESFAHDAGNTFVEGRLVVDMAGRTVGIDVASFVPGISYAVPLAAALARFPELSR